MISGTQSHFIAKESPYRHVGSRVCLPLPGIELPLPSPQQVILLIKLSLSFMNFDWQFAYVMFQHLSSATYNKHVDIYQQDIRKTKNYVFLMFSFNELTICNRVFIAVCISPCLNGGQSDVNQSQQLVSCFYTQCCASA